MINIMIYNINMIYNIINKFVIYNMKHGLDYLKWRIVFSNCLGSQPSNLCTSFPFL